MKHLEQIKEIVNSEIGRFATVKEYTTIAESQSFEEYEVSFVEKFNPILIRAYPDGGIQIKVGDFYKSVSTINSSCCYLYVALMNASQKID